GRGGEAGAQPAGERAAAGEEQRRPEQRAREQRVSGAWGVISRTKAPRTPPTMLSAPRSRSWSRPPPKTSQWGATVASERGERATGVVALTAVEGTPARTSVGKEMRLRSPAVELSAPARSAAPKRTPPLRVAHASPLPRSPDTVGRAAPPMRPH